MCQSLARIGPVIREFTSSTLVPAEETVSSLAPVRESLCN
jgi:hypothetical protein